MSIVIDQSLHADTILVLYHLCLNIQNEYDISPKLVNYLINQPNFIENCEFLQEQTHIEMELNLEKHTHSDANEHIHPNDYENCAHLIRMYDNGYVSHCNIHRYLHPQKQPDSLDKPTIDHLFEKKTEQQIIKEKYYETVRLIYQSYINKLYDLVHQIFSYDLISNSLLELVPIGTDQYDDLIDHMCQNHRYFKSKRIFKHREPGQSTEKYQYLKLYIYTPDI
jgi:hypothetical protein